MKHCQMHPTLRNAPKPEFRVQWGWIGCVRCEKFWCDFMPQTCALIAPVQPVLHQVSCSNETLTNTPKHYETHKNMSLGSNGVDRVCSLRTIPMRLHGTTLCINCTSSINFHRVPCSIKTLPNAPKCDTTQENKSLGSTWLDRVCSFRKIPRWLHGTNLFINYTGSTYFAPSFV